MSGMRPQNLHYKKDVRWCWCCWSWDHILTTNVKVYNWYNLKNIILIIINGCSIGDRQISKYRKVTQLGTTFSPAFLITLLKTHTLSEVHAHKDQLRAYRADRKPATWKDKVKVTEWETNLRPPIVFPNTQPGLLTPIPRETWCA